jgi:hypothetical protein
MEAHAGLEIIKQFDIKIGKNTKEGIHIGSKDSSISTTNQTSSVSGDQFCFSKKLKDSHITINLE